MSRTFALSGKLCISLICLSFTLIACDRSSPSSSQATDTVVATDEATPPEVVAPDEVPSRPEVVHEPLLWQIDGPHGPVYMLGTIHVGFDAREELPQFVWDKLDASKVFYMETDLGKVELQAAQKSALPEGQSLDRMLSEESWKELDDRMGGTASNFRSFKPWFIVSMLTLKMLPDGVNKGASMDQELHKHAGNKGLALRYLEDPNYQLSVLEETLTIEELEDMLKNFDEQKSDLAKLLDYYKKGDMEEMKTVSFKDKDRKPEMYEKLFYVRNEAWVPQIDSAIEEGNVFFAFGAGHLLGERGVLDLLEKRGYKPYRVTKEVVEKQKSNAAQTQKPADEDTK